MKSYQNLRFSNHRHPYHGPNTHNFIQNPQIHTIPYLNSVSIPLILASFLLVLFFFFSPLLFLLSRFFSLRIKTNFGLIQWVCYGHVWPLNKTHFWVLFFIFLLILQFLIFAIPLMPYSNLTPHISSNSIITYNLILLCLLCPQVVNYHFTLVSNIHFGSLVLFPKTYI